jgi:hypothetical protein
MVDYSPLARHTVVQELGVQDDETGHVLRAIGYDSLVGLFPDWDNTAYVAVPTRESEMTSLKQAKSHPLA